MPRWLRIDDCTDCPHSDEDGEICHEVDREFTVREDHACEPPEWCPLDRACGGASQSEPKENMRPGNKLGSLVLMNDLARRIYDTVMRELQGRKGFDWWWGGDRSDRKGQEEIQKEITEALISRITSCLLDSQNRGILIEDAARRFQESAKVLEGALGWKDLMVDPPLADSGTEQEIVPVELLIHRVTAREQCLVARNVLWESLDKFAVAASGNRSVAGCQQEPPREH
jgi:hypothetical protein